MSNYTVAALYKFVRLDDYIDIQPKLLAFCKSQNIIGTLLLGLEGINGTVAGTREDIDALKRYLESDERFKNTEYKESWASEVPFYRMKVKLKKEIVTLGVEGVDPTCVVGEYVEPQDWNALITRENVIIVDTRNDYEYEIGTFKGAINPNTQTFREFPAYVEKHLDPKKHKHVAMFCTGGIRCEKSTAYLLTLGFEKVYHLKGGILRYLEEIPEEESLWEGECFVFDNRVAVKHGLAEGSYDQCHGCRYPITENDKKSEYYVPGVICPRCHDKRSIPQVNSALERQKQMMLAAKRGDQHLGEKSA